jgi:uncharacterized protein with FMN-binding domain
MKAFYVLFGSIVALSATLFITGCVGYLDIHPALPDISGKPDGVYRGSYKVGPVEATVDVALSNAAISGITIIEHNCSPFGKPAEAITQRVIDRQSLDVDAISGATASSKAILKAVEEE